MEYPHVIFKFDVEGVIVLLDERDVYEQQVIIAIVDSRNLERGGGLFVGQVARNKAVGVEPQGVTGK